MTNSPSAAARRRLALVVRTAGEDWGEDEELLKSGLHCGDVLWLLLLAPPPLPMMRSGESKFLRRFEGDAAAAAAVVVAVADAATVAATAVALSTINGALLLGVARGGMGVA